MEGDTVYERFSGDKFTVKKYLWTRFIIKEQKLITTRTKRFHFTGRDPLIVGQDNSAKWQFSHWKRSSKLQSPFFVGRQYSDFNKV